MSSNSGKFTGKWVPQKNNWIFAAGLTHQLNTMTPSKN